MLAACSQPNRRCGRGGAGAHIATESDDALSQWYVRPGLVFAAAVGRSIGCAAGRVLVRWAEVATGWRRIAFEVAGARACRVVEGRLLAAHSL
jgi:hypothetical protein